MGTGTYLNSIIERAARRAVVEQGEGIGGGIVTDLAQRIVGFELQMGPYAVAELRTSDLLRGYEAEPPVGGMRTYVTNALDDPFTEIDQIASSLQAISESRRRANEIKGETPVHGRDRQPALRRAGRGQGRLDRAGPSAGREARGSPHRPPLDAFRAAGNGQAEYVLKNLYVYFWRWGHLEGLRCKPRGPGRHRLSDHHERIPAGARLQGDARVPAEVLI